MIATKADDTHSYWNVCLFLISLCLPPFGSQLVFLFCKIWGKDVDKFRPERWLDEEGRVKSVPEFIPFGIGKSLFLFIKCHTYVTRRLNQLPLATEDEFLLNGCN